MVTTGDRGDGNRAQDMRDDAGAVIRINPDGSIPADNPSPDGSKWLPEIWSKGHRNAQGAIYDPVTKGLLTVEHGAMGGDEVNRPEAGKNYGWPVITYGVDYSGEKIGIGTEAPGYEQPLFYWDPSIAPSGLAVYEGDNVPGMEGRPARRRAEIRAAVTPRPRRQRRDRQGEPHVRRRLRPHPRRQDRAGRLDLAADRRRRRRASSASRAAIERKDRRRSRAACFMFLA